MIKVRPFSPVDLEKVMEIEKTSFSKRQAYSRKYLEKLYQNYPQGFIVAENNNEIVGYTIGQLKNNKAGEIISIAVHPNWRQQNIGRQLTKFLIDNFKKSEIKKTFLYVRTENKVGIAFYENLGFKTQKTIKNYYRNGDDSYLMRKEI